MMNRTILRHFLFWLSYFSIHLFNEIFLSYSWSMDPSVKLMMQSILALGLLLLVKIPAVYYVLYAFIPRWQRTDDRKKLWIESIAVAVAAIIIYRLLIHFVIWPYIYKEWPKEITALQFTARIFYSLLDILQVVAIAAAIKLLRLRMSAMKKEKELIREKLHSELLQLKSQVNPHFLFNSLNSIYSLSRTHSEETPGVVMKLSGILRHMLYENSKSLVEIGAELKVIDDYLELQQVRFGKKRSAVIYKDVPDLTVMIPPLIVLPLIENAFKHGAANADPITCSVHADHDMLHVVITNSVPDIPSKREDEGLGLINIKRQLELMYRDYNFDYGLKEKIFTVDLTVNLKSYAGNELFDSRG
jgi:two-component system, LytTR family, sensor kinase